MLFSDLHDICLVAYKKNGSKETLRAVQQWLHENERDPYLLTEAAHFKNEENETPLHYLVSARPPPQLVERLLLLAPGAAKFFWRPILMVLRNHVALVLYPSM